MRIFDGIWNEIRLSYFRARRYWPESIAAFIATLSVFFSLLYAVMALGEVPLGSGRLDGLIIGFALWMFAGTAYAGTSAELAEEIRQRTLEQLCIAPITLWAILGLRAALKLAAGTCVFLVMLVAIKLFMGDRVQLSYTKILGTILLAAPSLVGLGYLISGLLLLARRAEAIQMLVYPALIGVIACPAYPVNMAAVLPFSLGASTARELVAGANLAWSTYLLIGLISLLWLLTGLVVFRRLERHARRLGIMGHL